MTSIKRYSQGSDFTARANTTARANDKPVIHSPKPTKPANPDDQKKWDIFTQTGQPVPY